MKRALAVILLCTATLAAQSFEGRYFRGKGDVEYLKLLEKARRMFTPDAEFESIAMFYEPRWNGFTEGPTWDAWWIQNSYGTTYTSLPFLTEPYTTFIRNSQELWWSQMGDGKRVGGPPPYDWVAPDGTLCDAARPGWIVYRQGDVKYWMHDWGVEFTAAGLVMQSEMHLIERDMPAIRRELPRLERAANFLDTRRDPKNNLMLAGAAGNLMAPSYAGYRKPDGTYDKAYLAGLSVTYIAALDRLIELEKMAGAVDKVKLYTARREAVRSGLPKLMTDEGYFVKSVDPDGTRHGVLGQAKYGYFEAAPNHDAIAFRVVDDAQARKIYDKIASLPGLRPYDLIITNYPSLDDMYEEPKGMFRFGHWVNGGHWSTCEGRMLMGYARLGQYDDMKRSMQRILKYAETFRMDNNLVDFGNGLYQPNQPINVVYDSFAVPAGLIRGLFEYLYRADGLTVLPHIPGGITELDQRFPVRFGSHKLYLSTRGTGAVTGVVINGQSSKEFDAQSVKLRAERLPAVAHVQILLGGAKASAAAAPVEETAPAPKGAERMAAFCARMKAAGMGDAYEAAHAAVAVDMLRAAGERARLLKSGELKPLAEVSRTAADQLYADTARKLMDGLDHVIQGYAKSTDPKQKRIYEIYHQ